MTPPMLAPFLNFKLSVYLNLMRKGSKRKKVPWHGATLTP